MFSSIDPVLFLKQTCGLLTFLIVWILILSDITFNGLYFKFLFWVWDKGFVDVLVWILFLCYSNEEFS